MAPKPAQTSQPLRRLTCERCGSAFDCSLAGDCWCAAEPFRLPMPDNSEDCLCPACLRAAAARHAPDTNRL